jgi:hypothetical protein
VAGGRILRSASKKKVEAGEGIAMELTWVAIAASLLMGLGAACVFILAVRKGYFQNIEDAKYQVFWSDLEETNQATEVEEHVGDSEKDA